MREEIVGYLAAVLTVAILMIVLICLIKRSKLQSEVLKTLGFKKWNIVPNLDDYVVVKSRQTLEKYDYIKYFKDKAGSFEKAQRQLDYKTSIKKQLEKFLSSNDFQNRSFYKSAVKKINLVIGDASAFRVKVDYVSSAGNHLAQKVLCITSSDIKKCIDDPSLLMGKGEYNKLLKEKQKEELDNKRHEFYEKVNQIVDYTSENKEKMVIRGKQEALDNLIAQLFDRTVNSIQKIKTIDSEEWDVINRFISGIESDIKQIVEENKQILDYYESDDFKRIKETCNTLMSTQREFNDYINEKVQTISSLFGTRVMRNETVSEDENNYIRPYKKTLTPFTAEVSSNVFASAENNPMEYIVKNFYPNKDVYPEQIQKLHLLVEELETLREAKEIIDNYKKDYQQYLSDVPSFIMEKDEVGFYSRLGFAIVDENSLTVEYKFSYTSGGGYAQRSFTVPMTEENIVELIQILEGKLTASAFTKQQRLLMTKKLREYIKNRDNFTCCNCGNSTHAEPNLLLEIDHIIPVSKGGVTEESNLQTLCWKCNRSKADKIM